MDEFTTFFEFAVYCWQMKQDDEDEWVQEALADLLYLPYTSAGDRYVGAYETML